MIRLVVEVEGDDEELTAALVESLLERVGRQDGEIERCCATTVTSLGVRSPVTCRECGTRLVVRGGRWVVAAATRVRIERL